MRTRLGLTLFLHSRVYLAQRRVVGVRRIDALVAADTTGERDSRVVQHVVHPGISDVGEFAVLDGAVRGRRACHTTHVSNYTHRQTHINRRE